MLSRLLSPTVCRHAFWLCALAVLVLSLIPTVPQLPTTGWDKTNHLLGFVVLAVLGHLAWPGRTWALLLGLLAFGALIEGLQSLTPYRLAEWGDWLADALGIALGQALARPLGRHLRATDDTRPS